MSDKLFNGNNDFIHKLHNENGAPTVCLFLEI